MVVGRASLFIAACQYYSLFLDGQRVGDRALDGPWTAVYTNRSYSTLEIDPALLKPGPHTLGIRVGQGFCTSTLDNMYDPNAERAPLSLFGEEVVLCSVCVCVCVRACVSA